MEIENGAYVVWIALLAIALLGLARSESRVNTLFRERDRDRQRYGSLPVARPDETPTEVRPASDEQWSKLR